MADLEVILEDDPVPIVLIFGNMLKASLALPARSEIAATLIGSCALASTTDPQALTIDFSPGQTRIRHGVSRDAKIIIHLDFADMDAKPRVERLWRHPLFAYRVGQLLEPITTSWTEAAKRFWDLTAQIPGMPTGIKITNTDEQRSLQFGSDSHEVELHGDSKSLSSLLNGSGVLANEVMQGRLKILGSLEHMVVLSEVTFNLMLGNPGHD